MHREDRNARRLGRLAKVFGGERRHRRGAGGLSDSDRYVHQRPGSLAGAMTAFAPSADVPPGTSRSSCDPTCNGGVLPHRAPLSDARTGRRSAADRETCRAPRSRRQIGRPVHHLLPAWAGPDSRPQGLERSRGNWSPPAPPIGRTTIVRRGSPNLAAASSRAGGTWDRDPDCGRPGLMHPSKSQTRRT